jgi:ankyrin repeat protein
MYKSFLSAYIKDVKTIIKYEQLFNVYLSVYSSKQVNIDFLWLEFKSDNIDIVDLIIVNSHNPSHLYFCLDLACIYGHEGLTNLLISKGIFCYHRAFLYACIGGHENIVNIIISKGNIDDYEEGLIIGCKRGHLGVVKLLISKVTNLIILNTGLYYACLHGHMNIIPLLIKSGANDRNLAIRGAYRGRNFEIAEFLFSKNSKYSDKVLDGYIKYKYELVKLKFGSDLTSVIIKYLWPSIKINNLITHKAV